MTTLPEPLKDGVVVIQVLEAKYGKVTLHNKSRITDSLLKLTLAPLRVGEVIEQTEMDHVLFLISDVPKIEVHALIRPGESVGTSDLDATTLPGPRWSAIASVAQTPPGAQPERGSVPARAVRPVNVTR